MGDNAKTRRIEEIFGQSRDACEQEMRALFEAGGGAAPGGRVGVGVGVGSGVSFRTSPTLTIST